MILPPTNRFQDDSHLALPLRVFFWPANFNAALLQAPALKNQDNLNKLPFREQLPSPGVMLKLMCLSFKQLILILESVHLPTGLSSASNYFHYQKRFSASRPLINDFSVSRQDEIKASYSCR